MIKFSRTSDYDLDISPVSILKSSSELVKRASAKDLLKYSKTKGQTDLHIIALGSYEGTGYNRNGDAFSEADCKKNHHHFTKSNRAVHRHHKNKPEDLKYGNIKASAYNDNMKRIELVVGLDNDKCADILDEQEKTGNTNFSMACVLDPKFPVITASGYKPISEIKVGDLVHTHKGNWKRVTELRHSKYSGRTIKLKLNGMPEFPELTENHPLFATVFPVINNYDKQFRYFKDPSQFNDNPPDWVHISHLKIGDRLYYRSLSKIPDVAGIDDVLLAKLLGYYTAEGSINGGCVQLCCNTSDSLPKVIPALFEELFPGITVSLAPSSTSKVCLNVNIFSTDLVNVCRMYCGRLADKKFIGMEMFNSPEKTKLNFFGAWLDGDGFIDKKGVHISSCNYNLILQGRDLLMTMGIPASIYRIDHAKCATSGYENSGIEYTLNVSWIDGHNFLGYSQKVDNTHSTYMDEIPLEDRKKPACLRECFEPGLYAYRISGIEENFVDDVPVYNFEVEEDHSYTLGGVISHNCKIASDECSWCHHRSKTGKDRCSCIPEHLGEINKEGEMCGMLNTPDPHWFEISYVRRPADRIGMSLKKLAEDSTIKPMSTSDFLNIYTGFVPPAEDFLISKKAADKRDILTKLAELEKHVDAAVNDARPSGKNLFIARSAKKLNQADSLSDDTIDELRKFEPSKLLKCLANNGIIFSPEEFSKYTFGDRVPKARVEGMKTHLPRAFSEMSEGDSAEVSNNDKFEPSSSDMFPPEMKKLISSLVAGHSLNEGPAIKRIMRITIMCGNGSDESPKPQEKTKEAFDRELAKQYCAYKIAALNYMNENNQMDEDVLLNSVIQNRK